MNKKIEGVPQGVKPLWHIYIISGNAMVEWYTNEEPIIQGCTLHFRKRDYPRVPIVVSGTWAMEKLFTNNTKEFVDSRKTI